MVYAAAGIRSIVMYKADDASRRLKIAERFVHIPDTTDLIETVISPIYGYNLYI
ncbi:MAG: hypothetical protein JWR23_2188 [Mucilaginibacter sp.]|nr:hypothetical protein [Mucilaginibacter sp.]